MTPWIAEMPRKMKNIILQTFDEIHDKEIF